jgi:lysozyme family protein
MSDFAYAQRFLSQWEGGYVNDPLDPGGETLHGITRRDFPTWEGWPIWEREKRDTPELLAARDAFYERNFWRAMNLHLIPSRRLAAIVYQAAVNCGTRRVGRWLQSVLNSVMDADLVVDGRVGDQTIRAVMTALEKGYSRLVEDGVLAKQRNHYDRLVSSRPTLERFHRGWINRIKAAEKL